ncbi:MAG: hypothetical protein JSS82_12820 [Bacteroidetes bacterium]|nr:hypothetical protein [Bacteroidota bacterium]
MKSLISAVCMLILSAVMLSSCAVGDGNYLPGHYKKRSYWKQHVKYGPAYYNHYAPARHGSYNTNRNPEYR